MAPSRRPRQRRVPNESDYDTDVNQQEPGRASSGHNAAETPGGTPPRRTNEELNISVLRRQYPDINQILSIAPFAVVYAFSPESQSWEKTGVEGTLFVCQLVPTTSHDRLTERYIVVVLNRRGLQNYLAELHSTKDIEITDEYVILQVIDEKSQTETVNGLWIFSEPEPSSTAKAREINAQIIVECAARAEQSLAPMFYQSSDSVVHDDHADRAYHVQNPQMMHQGHWHTMQHQQTTQHAFHNQHQYPHHPPHGHAHAHVPAFQTMQQPMPAPSQSNILLDLFHG